MPAKTRQHSIERLRLKDTPRTADLRRTKSPIKRLTEKLQQ